MMTNVYFILKAPFVLKIFNFLSWFFGHVEKPAWLERQAKFRIDEVTAWLANNCNTRFAQYLPN